MKVVRQGNGSIELADFRTGTSTASCPRGSKLLCQRAGIYPCVLDAAIFAKYDADAWEDAKLLW